MHACMHACIHTYMHTYIVHTYVRTYVHTYIHVVIFDALAQASDFRIERRQVVFLCWMQDSNPRPHDAAYCLLTHHWQLHEIIFPPYLAYIRPNCLGMDVNNLESILVQVMTSQLTLRRWPNVGIGRHRRDRQPTSRQRWYSVACVATVCWHSVGARRLAYRSLPMFCVWTSVVGNQVFLE